MAGAGAPCGRHGVDRSGEESWCRRHCSKGSSGNAIPCQAKPLTRQHGVRSELEEEGCQYRGFAKRTATGPRPSWGAGLSLHRVLKCQATEPFPASARVFGPQIGQPDTRSRKPAIVGSISTRLSHTKCRCSPVMAAPRECSIRPVSPLLPGHKVLRDARPPSPAAESSRRPHHRGQSLPASRG